jgi:hypothetical protein
MYLISPNDRLKGADEEVKYGLAESTVKTILPRVFAPTFSQMQPERVTLSRASALAKRSLDFMKQCLSGKEQDWTAIFQETTSSLLSYSALLRVDQDFVIDPETSSTVGDLGMQSSKEHDGIETSYTRSMRNRFLGPKVLRLKNYRNLQNGGDLSVMVGE